MKRQISLLSISSMIALAFLFAGCTNQNGAAGSADGTSEQAYELNSEENLASPMDSAQQAAPADGMAPADTTE